MSEPAQPQSRQNDTDLPVGEILRRTRVHYKRSVQDVENALRIRSEQIEAIEQGNMKALPGRVYAIGFVRSYAEYLGLDGDKIVALFKVQTDGVATSTNVKPKPPVEETKVPPVWLVVACLVVICVVLISLFGGGGGSSDADEAAQIESVPEVPTELKVETLDAPKSEVDADETEIDAAAEASKAGEQEQGAAVELQAPIIEEAPKPKGIILKMVDNSWIEIRDQSHRKLISRVLKAGDQYFVPDRADLSMSIGNAVGVQILVDGEPLNNLGGEGQVLRNIPLNADVLKKRFSKPVEN